jgi:hypothetical protein
MTAITARHKFKEVHVDGERYISDDIESQIKWLQLRSEELYIESLFDTKAAFIKLYQIIGMISVENN